MKNLSANTMFYNATGHVYWKNKYGVYLGCNSNQAHTLGLESPAEIIGKSDFDLLWKNDAVICRKNDLYVVDSGKPEIVEEKTTINDQCVTYQSHKIPLINKHNVIIGVFGISTDISDCVRLPPKNNVTPEEHEQSRNIAFNNLSPQELIVLKMLAAGKPRKVISKEMGLSIKTVDTYRSRIFGKLNIKNNIELMHFIIRNNLRHLIPWV